MNETERLQLENDLAIIQFLLYPKNPDDLIKQKNKIIEVLAPANSEFDFASSVSTPKTSEVKND